MTSDHCSNGGDRCSDGGGRIEYDYTSGWRVTTAAMVGGQTVAGLTTAATTHQHRYGSHSKYSNHLIVGLGPQRQLGW